MRRSGSRRRRAPSLQRRMFWWFGATIAASALVIALVLVVLSDEGGGSYRRELRRFERFAAAELARVWDDPAARRAFAESAAQHLDVGVSLHDAAGRWSTQAGPSCAGHVWPGELVVEVLAPGGGERLGVARFCVDRRGHRLPLGPVLPTAAAMLVLWAACGLIARRIARPLRHLASVARALGGGDLGSRARIGCHEVAEMATLGEALNDMAARIEAHVTDQRTLLAGVSHELRTPLGHLRLLVELLREKPLDDDARRRLDEIEREVVEMDDLVGKLLASARLDFSLEEPRPLDAVDVARRALQRAGLAAELLDVDDAALEVEGDPTLLGRALSNLLENAAAHGGGVERLRVVAERDAVAFVVEDRGRGLPDGAPEQLFQPFVRKADEAERGSLGLGLYLVRRVALAHGGSVLAEQRPGGGARIGFRVPRRGA